MTKKHKICFSNKYSKLGKPIFTTVRWLDAEYRLGAYYEVFLVAQNMFHTKYGKGKYRLVKMEVKRLRDLSDEFIRADADCSRGVFMELMFGWYSKKPDWKGEDSEVQVLYLEKKDG